MKSFAWCIAVNLLILSTLPISTHAFRVYEVVNGNTIPVLPSEVSDESNICKPENLKINYWIDRAKIPSNLTLEDVRQAIRIAVSGWESIGELPNPIEFREAFSAPDPLYNPIDDVTVITWDTNATVVGSEQFAIASNGCNPTTIKYTSGTDIYLNGHRSILFWTMSKSLASVPIGSIYLPGILTHEFGHVLGLEHSEELFATMTPMPILSRAGIAFYQDVIGWVSLEKDDIEGIKFLYGNQNIDPACHTIDFPDSLPEGWGAPYSTSSSQHEILIQAECKDNKATVTVGNNQDGFLTYVWMTTHYWLNGQLQSTQLQCNEQIAGWCKHSGQTTININPDETWVLGYICQWDGNQWYCGCRDDSCDPHIGTGGLWQAQRLLR